MRRKTARLLLSGGILAAVLSGGALALSGGDSLCPVAVLHGPDPANPNAGGQQSPHHLGPLAPTGGPDSVAYDAAGQPCFGGRHPHRPVL